MILYRSHTAISSPLRFVCLHVRFRYHRRKTTRLCGIVQEGHQADLRTTDECILCTRIANRDHQRPLHHIIVEILWVSEASQLVETTGFGQLATQQLQYLTSPRSCSQNSPKSCSFKQVMDPQKALFVSIPNHRSHLQACSKAEFRT